MSSSFSISLLSVISLLILSVCFAEVPRQPMNLKNFPKPPAHGHDQQLRSVGDIPVNSRAKVESLLPPNFHQHSGAEKKRDVWANDVSAHRPKSRTRLAAASLLPSDFTGPRQIGAAANRPAAFNPKLGIVEMDRISPRIGALGISYEMVIYG